MRKGRTADEMSGALLKNPTTRLNLADSSEVSAYGRYPRRSSNQASNPRPISPCSMVVGGGTCREISWSRQKSERSSNPSISSMWVSARRTSMGRLRISLRRLILPRNFWASSTIAFGGACMSRATSTTATTVGPRFW